MRRFQLHLVESGASIGNRNRIMTGVRFLFRVALRRRELAAEIWPSQGAAEAAAGVELALTQLVNASASGDLRATQLALSLLPGPQEKAAPRKMRRIGKEDSLVVAEIIRRFSRPPAPAAQPRTKTRHRPKEKRHDRRAWRRPPWAESAIVAYGTPAIDVALPFEIASVDASIGRRAADGRMAASVDIGHVRRA